MARNILWLLVTAAVLALALVYPTSADRGVPLGRTDDPAVAVKVKNAPGPAKAPAPRAPSPGRQ